MRNNKLPAHPLLVRNTIFILRVWNSIQHVDDCSYGLAPGESWKFSGFDDPHAFYNSLAPISYFVGEYKVPFDVRYPFLSYIVASGYGNILGPRPLSEHSNKNFREISYEVGKES